MGEGREEKKRGKEREVKGRKGDEKRRKKERKRNTTMNFFVLTVFCFLPFLDYGRKGLYDSSRHLLVRNRKKYEGEKKKKEGRKKQEEE